MIKIEIGQQIKFMKKCGYTKFYPREEGKVIKIDGNVIFVRTSAGQTWKITPQENGGNDLIIKG